MASHTATGEWQRFEFRMRRRRAERLVERAKVLIEAGSFQDARPALEEARALWPAAPGLHELEERIAIGREERLATAREERIAIERVPAIPDVHPSRWKEVAAAAATVLFAGAAAAAALTRAWNVLPARDARAIVEPIPIVARAPVTLQDESQSVEPVQPDASEPSEPVRPIEPAESVGAATQPSVAEPKADAPVAELKADPRVAEPKVETPRPIVSVALPDAPPSRAPLDTALPEAARPDVTTPAPVTTPSSSSSPPPAPAPVRSSSIAARADGINTPVPPQEPPVRNALARYAAAYSDLDVDAVKRVWPGVNRAALTRAFESLISQRVSLGDCRIQVQGAAARARCTGSATWTPRVGGGAHTDARTWNFDLERSAAGWQIVSARVQNR